MKCKVCNAELSEGQSFCAYCGTKVEEAPIPQQATEPAVEYVDPNATTVLSPEDSPYQPQALQYYNIPTQETASSEAKDPADKSALVGMILGICSLVLCCIGLPTGIVGIIFSIKGLKSKTRKGMAIPGLITSILAVINFFSFWGGFAQGLFQGMMKVESLSMILSNLLF